MVLRRIIGYKQQIEIMCANIERAAQLRIVCTLLTGVGMRRLFVFLLLRQILKRVVQSMRRPGLLGKQQGKSKQQRKEDAGKLHNGSDYNKYVAGEAR